MKYNTIGLAKVRLAKVRLARYISTKSVKKSHLSAGSKRVINSG